MFSREQGDKMKEVTFVKDSYGCIRIQQLNPMEFMRIKLHKGNKIFEREISMKDGTNFKVYSILCLHNGDECWLRMTTAVAREVGKAEIGDVINITAVKSPLKGGKSYLVEIIEEASASSIIKATEQDELVFEKIITFMIEHGKSLSDYDDYNIEFTFFHDFGYEPIRAKEIVPVFKEYYKKGKV